MVSVRTRPHPPGFTSTGMWPISNYQHRVAEGSRLRNFLLGLSRAPRPESTTVEPNRLNTKVVPNQAPGPPNAVAITRPADLNCWIDALPFANLGGVLANLDNELSLLNNATVKAPVRFDLLELHAGAYVRLLASLSRAQGSRGVNALEQHRAFAETARRLTLRMADGYKLIVGDTVARKFSLFANRRSDIAPIQRAALFLCYSLNHCYDQYLPTEARVWAELAKLYRLASERSSLDRSVSRGELRPEFGKPISALYKLALLTGLANPYQHGPGEVWKMFEFLEECADAAVLGTEPPSRGSECIFVIDPDGIEHARPLDADRDIANGYFFDTKPVSELLQRMRDEAEQGGRDAFPTARSKKQLLSILSRVIRSLNEPAQRSNDRKPKSVPVHLAIGITAAQYHIDATTVVGTEATFTAGPGATVHDREPDLESKNDRISSLKMVDPRSGSTIDVGVTAKVRRRAAGAKSGGGGEAEETGIMATYGTEPWQVTNKSRAGIGILRYDPPRIPLCVGEVVSIAAKGRVSAIGLVRWLTIDEAGIHRAGAEIIATRADCVSLRPTEDEDNPGAARPALALPFFGAGEKVASLVAPPGTFSEQGELIVESLNSEFQVRIEMTNLIDATPSCERFSYRIAPRGR
jgi:hypothetical protein